MAISPRAVGAWAYAASGSVTPTLPTHATGDMLLVRVAYKSSNLANCLASTATSGWAKVGEFVGTGNSGNGTGGVNVAVFWKEAASASETNPTIDFSQTVTQVGHSAVSFQKGGGENWFTPLGEGGEDTTADTSKSMTMTSHLSVTSGDMVVFFLGIRDDCTVTVPTITQTGVTFAAVVEYPATAGIDTSGADGAYDAGYRLATAGTSSAAAVITATLNTSETGSAWMTRLRAGVLTNAAAGLASGTGSAATVARIDVKTNAAIATGIGAAPQPGASVAVNAGLATGTGSALDATADTGGAESYVQAVEADSPVAWWRMGESSGLIQDSAGTNHATAQGNPVDYSQTGALAGDADTAIQVAQAGGSERFVVPDATALDFGNGPFTVEAWLKRSATSSSWHIALAKGTQLNFEFFNNKFIVDNDSGNQVVGESGTTTDTGVYHHFVWTRSGTGTGNNKIYKDGVDVTQDGAGINDVFSSNATNLSIGAYTSGTLGFEGTMDEVALYASALSAARVLAHYNAGVGVAETDAPAELASGTGAALAASAIVAPNAVLASGTGSALAATANVQPSAGLAAGVGEALQPGASVAVNAGLASGVGAAYDAPANVQPNAELASGTGAALDATADTGGGGPPDYTEFYGETDGTSVTNPVITINDVDWVIGDRLVIVVSGQEPTVVSAAIAATGLTFSLVGLENDDQNIIYAGIYKSDLAASGGTDVDITVTVTSTGTHQGGLHAACFVLSGSSPDIDNWNIGGGPLAVDDATPTLDLTVIADTRTFAVVQTRNRLFTVDAGDAYTTIRANDQVGAGGTLTTQSEFEKETLTAGSYNFSGTVPSAQNWIIAMFSAFTTSGAVEGEANAGRASGTGAAVQASPLVAPNAGIVAGTGTAGAAAPKVAPNAGLASGTGAAQVASASIKPNAGTAAGTGAAHNASPKVAPNAGLASGTGAALQPTVTTSSSANAPAGLAAGTGAALQPTINIAPNAGWALGFGNAAEGTSRSLSVDAGLASGTGSSGAPSPALAVNTGQGTGTGQAYDATVSTASSVTVNAGHASGTGVALGPSVDIKTNAGQATGTGTALQPAPAVAVNAGLASGTGTAYNAIVKREYTASWTLNAVVKREYSATFTLDAISLRTQSATFTLDATIALTISATTTLDAVIKRTYEASGSLDAVVLRTYEATGTLDAVLLRTYAATLTLDAVTRREVTASFTLDAWFLRVEERTAPLDAILFRTYEASYSLDAVIMPSATLDAIIKRTYEASFALDAVIMPRFSLDAVIEREEIATFTLDSFVQGEGVAAYSLDAVILRTYEASYALDAVLLRTGTASFTLDAVVLRTGEATATLDAVLFRTNTASFTLDAVLLRGATATFTLDAWILRTEERTATFDAVIFETVEATFTLDAIFMPSFTLDAIVLRTQTTSFSIDAVIMPVFTLDALLRRTESPTFTLDSFVQGEGVFAYALDAVFLRTFTGTFSTDALVNRTVTATLSLDAVILRTYTATFTLNAVQLKTSSAGFTTDALIRETRTAGYAFDAVVLSPTQAVFTLDAVIQPALGATFTLDAVLAETVEAIFTLDAYLLFLASGSFTLDTVIFRPRTFTLNAFLVLPPATQFDPISATHSAETISATLGGDFIHGPVSGNTLSGL